MNELELIRLGLAFAALGVVGLLALTTREVPDWVWLIFAPIGALPAIYMAMVGQTGITTVVSMVLSATIAAVIFKAGDYTIERTDGLAVLFLSVVMPISIYGTLFYPLVVLGYASFLGCGYSALRRIARKEVDNVPFVTFMFLGMVLSIILHDQPFRIAFG